MKRGWLLLFLLSLGLNIGLGYTVFQRHSQAVREGHEDTNLRGRRQGLGRGGDGPGERFMERRLNRLVRHLQLDSAQEEEFRRVRETMLPKIAQHRESVQQARQQLHAACLEPGSPPDSVRQRVRALAIAQGWLDSVVTETLLRELDLLDPVQRQSYLATMPWDLPAGQGPPSERQRRGYRRDR